MTRVIGYTEDDLERGRLVDRITVMKCRLHVAKTETKRAKLAEALREAEAALAAHDLLAGNRPDQGGDGVPESH